MIHKIKNRVYKEKSTRTTRDVCGFNAFERSELAVAINAKKLGDNFREILKETEKDVPDEMKIMRLNKIRKALSEEKLQIYKGNVRIQKKCIQTFRLNPHAE